MTTILERIARDCDETAYFYEKKPGLVHAATISDLYRTIAMFARVVDAADEDEEKAER